MALTMLHDSAAALAASLPAGGGGLGWRELDNKLAAFHLFQDAETRRSAPLGDRVRRALLQDVWTGLFTAEGLSHAAVSAGEPLAGEGPLGGLPRRALIPLHTGLGLALAVRALPGFAAAPSNEELAAALDAFAVAARSAAREGCEGAVLEALGVAVRNLDPRLVPALDAVLQERDPELRECFWHGVGRGLYFAPTHALPVGSPTWRAVGKALAEPPDEVGRRNALAGLAWALTLVNFRHPEVLAHFLACHGDGLPAGDAFAHGVAMAVLVWMSAAGSGQGLEAFLGHPVPSAVAPLWDRHVRRPCAAAVEELWPRLAAGACGGLFRYRPLAAAGGGS